jgi:hypothetical protein
MANPHHRAEDHAGQDADRLVTPHSRPAPAAAHHTDTTTTTTSTNTGHDVERPALFPLSLDPRGQAATSPLRHAPGTPSPAATSTNASLTLAAARRHAEITTALRDQHALLHTTINQLEHHLLDHRHGQDSDYLRRARHEVDIDQQQDQHLDLGADHQP